MRHTRLLIAAVLVGVLALGCKDSGGPAAHNVIGRWSGTFVDDGATLTLSLVLAENGSTLSGSGTLSVLGESLAVSASGTHSHPDVSITISTPGYQPSNITLTCTDTDHLTGRVNGSGFVNLAITLTRRP